MVPHLIYQISMKNFLILVPFIFLNSYASDPVYFPAQIKISDPPTVQMESDFDRKIREIPLIVNQRVVGYDENNRPTILPQGTAMAVQATLNQIYSGFKNSYQFRDMFTSNGQTESMFIESPDALKMKAAFSELIKIQMQEQMYDRVGVTGNVRKELTEVRVKAEGKVKKYKVDLETAVKDKAIEIGEVEGPHYALPTDYNGEESWSVEKKMEGTDIFKDCLACLPKKDKLRTQLEEFTVNQLIQKKFDYFSKSKMTDKMIKFAMSKKLSPEAYRAKRKDGKFIGGCYAAVKNALLDAKLVDDRPEGVSPRYAGEQLTSRGFINVMEDSEVGSKIKDPNQAPKGAILVYEPSPSTLMVRDYDAKKKRWIIVPDYGHIEIKTEVAGTPGVVSDYYSKNARTGKALENGQRKLVGIYVLDEKKLAAKNDVKVAAK